LAFLGPEVTSQEPVWRVFSAWANARPLGPGDAGAVARVRGRLDECRFLWWRFMVELDRRRRFVGAHISAGRHAFASSVRLVGSTPPAAPTARREFGLFRRQGAPAWAAIVLTVALLVGAFGFGVWKYASADHLGSIDNPQVLERANTACKQLEHDALPSPALPALVIRAQNAAIDVLISSMEQLGTKTLRGEPAASRWIADWRTLRDARAKYADELVATFPAGGAVFVVPKAHGIPITSRIGEAGVDCPVVKTLGDPPGGP
jgi:hypothetical protein